MTAGKKPRLALAPVVVCAWLLVLYAAVYLVASFALRVYVAIDMLPRDVGLRFALLDWKTWVMISAIIALLWIPLARIGSGAALTARPWFVIVSVLGVTSWWAWQTQTSQASATRFGFLPSMPPGDYDLPGDDVLPPQQVHVNALGFRDDEWTPVDPATRRVVVVGDSFVFGAGIPTHEGLLHAQLQRALDTEGVRWDVRSIAQRPSGLWYYVNALLAVSEELTPDVMVMNVLRDYDDVPFDDPRLTWQRSPLLLKAFKTFDTRQDFHLLVAGVGADYDSQNGPPSWAVAELRAQMQRLVAHLEQRGITLVIWEAHGPDAVLAPYRGHPGIVFANWKEDLPEIVSTGPAADSGDWTRDPSLCFQGNGHPTVKANGLIAGALARRIREALAARAGD